MRAWLDSTPYTLAHTPRGERSNADFRQAVMSVYMAMSESQEIDVSLYCTDAYHFAAGLFGAWKAGKIVHIPGDEISLKRLPHPLIVTDAEVSQLISETVFGHQNLCGIPRQTDMLVIYTSGSSGEPKAVTKTWAQLQAETTSLEQLFGLQLGDSVIVATVSHQHLYGLLFRVLWPLSAGRAFDSETAFFPEQLVEKTLRYPLTAWVSSPAHYKRTIEHMPWPKLAARLSALFSSGGILASEVAHELQIHVGKAVTEIFGSTETGGVAWRQQQEEWQPLPGVEVRASEDGALAVRSAHLGHKDWQATDDGALFGSKGGFTLTGRRDRIVKIEENRISLPGVEWFLMQMPEFQDVAVLSLDMLGRQQVCAVVVLSPVGLEGVQLLGKLAFLQSIRRQLRNVLEPMAIPRQWRFLDLIPTNSQGKTVDRTLRLLFEPASMLPDILHLRMDAGKYELTLSIPADAPYFEGHFERHPILPGVVQIHWAAQLARKVFLMPIGFMKMEAVKFQGIISPDQLVMLTLDWDAEKNRLAFAYHSEEGPHSSGRLVFSS